MPAPRFEHAFDHDVFISYTHEDNREEAGLHWVARFQAELTSRLAKVSGRSIQIWRDDRMDGATRFQPEIEQQLLASAVLIPIVTPSYIRSDWCRAERELFTQRAVATRGLDVGNQSRIVKVAKTRVPLAEYPEPLRELLEFRFYSEEPNGTTREFHLSPEESVQRRFYAVVDDAAQAIEKVLRGLATGAAPSTRGLVYIGEGSSDTDSEREQLRRSLIQRGYGVLPQAPLRLRTGPEVRQIAATDIAQCRLAVFPIGGYYGPVPERASDLSITELQLDAAFAGNGSISRLVWLIPTITVAEERQQRLVARVRTELPSRGFEILERPLTEVETHISDRLEQTPPPGETDDEDEEEGAEIYVLCLPDDRDAARLVRDYLFKEGYEVRFQPTTDEGAGVHQRRLESADAFLVYWGSADEGWLEPVLTELKKAKGFRKGKPILAKALVIADPPTPEKRDFLTHQAMLLRTSPSMSIEEMLRPMLAELRQARPERRA